ncbi:MAG TPA: N-acetylmuramoyl-L-alanine amidase [Anaerolineae bacterium]|nr:N-acetylmuramoyl-L-alanine amidase [Anaerolineae bacterium]HOQ98448.1 N-acetylmuramoyl-L-alanine amidase [Anaerolineae bacterium]HPL26731.1 N-acetylmuramoyl-L-alanine amidase [Anaerolineae bacterium]
MPARPSSIAPLRYPRLTPPRRARRWPWLIVLALVAAAVYVTLRPKLWPVPPAPTTAPRRPLVGIIAGHREFDSGAVCDDGLREVDITTEVTRQVLDRLHARGYEAEMLSEYDDRLAGYRAAALVSLHVDSCMFDLSGYKVAGSSHGPAARDSALLVEALSGAYAAATGLGFHADTITVDMTNYHAFQRIDPRTPAAIIEMGFMSGDRTLLVAHSDQAARGIADGVLAFLSAKAEEQRTPTPSN